ncbi:MAG TPA: NYN domain-containing protein [Anaerolineales bacterium]|nr:NYN domain-containing protein [Anaerolineales bacterium]
MPYLIDGHNLIPKLGLRLDSLDDESELVAILQEFCRLERRQVEVYFDGAPLSRTLKLGAVTQHFSPVGSTADNAIRRRLKSLGKAAKNWTVVSSDREVQSNARAMQAEVISSDEFAKILNKVRNSPRVAKGERVISEKEVEEWLKEFGGKKKETGD